MDDVTNKVKDFDGFLIAFNKTFVNGNNPLYFERFIECTKEIQNKIDERKFQLELHKLKQFTTEGEMVQYYTGVMPAKKDAEEISLGIVKSLASNS